jgi:hypothetical protein
MAFVGGGYDIAAFDFCHVERKKRGENVRTQIFAGFEAGMHCRCLVGGMNSMIEQEFVQDTRNKIEDLSALYKIVPHSILIRAISEVGGVSE